MDPERLFGRDRKRFLLGWRRNVLVAHPAAASLMRGPLVQTCDVIALLTSPSHSMGWVPDGYAFRLYSCWSFHAALYDIEQVFVGDMFLLVSQDNETSVGSFELRRIEFMAQLSQACIQTVPSRVFAQYKFRIRPPDGLGCHDLVGQAIFQHTVLVNASFVSKSIGAHYGFVGLYWDTCEPAHESTCRQKLLRIDACGNIAEDIRTRAQGHHNFFHSGIPCSFP